MSAELELTLLEDVRARLNQAAALPLNADPLAMTLVSQRATTWEPTAQPLLHEPPLTALAERWQTFVADLPALSSFSDLDAALGGAVPLTATLTPLADLTYPAPASPTPAPTSAGLRWPAQAVAETPPPAASTPSAANAPVSPSAPAPPEMLAAPPLAEPRPASLTHLPLSQTAEAPATAPAPPASPPGGDAPAPAPNVQRAPESFAEPLPAGLVTARPLADITPLAPRPVERLLDELPASPLALPLPPLTALNNLAEERLPVVLPPLAEPSPPSSPPGGERAEPPALAASSSAPAAVSVSGDPATPPAVQRALDVLAEPSAPALWQANREATEAPVLADQLALAENAPATPLVVPAGPADPAPLNASPTAPADLAAESPAAFAPPVDLPEAPSAPAPASLVTPTVEPAPALAESALSQHAPALTLNLSAVPASVAPETPARPPAPTAEPAETPSRPPTSTATPAAPAVQRFPDWGNLFNEPTAGALIQQLGALPNAPDLPAALGNTASAAGPALLNTLGGGRPELTQAMTFAQPLLGALTGGQPPSAALSRLAGQGLGQLAGQAMPQVNQVIGQASEALNSALPGAGEALGGLLPTLGQAANSALDDLPLPPSVNQVVQGLREGAAGEEAAGTVEEAAPAAPPAPPVNVERLTDQVWQNIRRRLQVERERTRGVA